MKLKWWHGALAIILFLCILAPLASSLPDGLERVAEDHGFDSKIHDPTFRIFPDYSITGIDNEVLATILAGLIGTILLFGIGFGLAKLLKNKHET
ncbi:MAG: PDGLE domain-containing protein [Chloroflexi bacterium]|nr:PDGLE domain-containing protein [Chloroflexota bacterium]